MSLIPMDPKLWGNGALEVLGDEKTDLRWFGMCWGIKEKTEEWEGVRLGQVI